MEMTYIQRAQHQYGFGKIMSSTFQLVHKIIRKDPYIIHARHSGSLLKSQYLGGQGSRIIHEFEASLGCRVRLHIKTNPRKQKLKQKGFVYFLKSIC